MKKSEISREKALEIAREDAQRVYRDLSIYTVSAQLEAGEWHVDYDLNNPKMVGGGPHYVISAKNGKILSRRFEQ